VGVFSRDVRIQGALKSDSREGVVSLQGGCEWQCDSGAKAGQTFLLAWSFGGEGKECGVRSFVLGLTHIKRAKK
jgi:hypothetical protein